MEQRIKNLEAVVTELVHAVALLLKHVQDAGDMQTANGQRHNASLAYDRAIQEWCAQAQINSREAGKIGEKLADLVKPKEVP